MSPGQFESGAELLEEVSDACLASRQTIKQEGTHNAPAQAGTVGDRLVDLVGRGDTVIDQVQGLPPNRLEQPVGDESIDLHAQHQRMHADRTVHRGGSLLGILARGLAAHDLDERQKVDGIEGMADADPARAQYNRPASCSARGPGRR